MKLVERGMVPIYEKDGQNVVNARELHEQLRVGRDFSTWITERLGRYGFVEGKDYSPISGNGLLPKSGERTGRGGQNRIEYALALDCAKEIAMVENNEQGRKIRRYFIECEKRLHEMSVATLIGNPQLVKSLAESVIAAQAALAAAEAKIEEDAPKLETYEAIMSAGEDCKAMDEVAKLIGIPGWGRNKMFAYLRDVGILRDNNQPYQPFINRGFFKLIEQTPWYDSDGIKHVPTKTVVTQRGIEYITKMVQAERKEAHS